MKRCDKADPSYPFPSRFGKNGEIIYSVPVEITSAGALETFGIRFADCGMLNFGNWKMRVYFIETANRAFAFDQRRWLNGKHTGELRYKYRNVSIELMAQNAGKKNINRAGLPLMAVEEQGYEQAETDDLRERMVAYVRKRFAKNCYYAEALMLYLENGYDYKEIAKALSIHERSARYFLRSAKLTAREYYQQYAL